MTLDVARAIGWQFFVTLWHVFPWLAGMGVVFTLLSGVTPCNAGKPWWKKSGLSTDIAYWFFVPVFSRYLCIALTAIGTALIFGITDEQKIADFYQQGHGWIGTLPLWAQGLLFLVVTDFVLYWSHRIFHVGACWKYHAVHHAPTQLEWLSAARFHPVNLLFGTVTMDIVMLLAGVSPEVFIVLGPFNTIVSTFVHANLNWTLGPLKYVFVSPVFHRWHHAVAPQDKNFASTFPVWDLMFGTFHMPQGQVPQEYGIDATSAPVPEGLLPQLIYPLKA